MMLRFLRKINIVLLILAVLQGVTLWRTQSVNAITAFLYEPFYGNWQESTKKYDSYPITKNASFDHNFPNYNLSNSNQTFTFRNGSIVPATNCGTLGGETNCYNGHPGIDYNLFYAPSVAAAAGQVIYAGWDNPNHDGFNLGLLVRIDHGNNYRTEYGHLSAVVAYTGRTIGAYDPYKKSHEQIGTSGNTGNSTGPHLHFEVQTLHNGAWKVVDPFGWTGQAGQDPWENRLPEGGVKSVNLWVAAPRQFPPPGDGPVVIDDGNSGFTSSSGWNIVSTGGYSNDLRWKLSSVSQTAWAKWNPTVPIRTTYEIQAYIPAYPSNNELVRTHAASYEIYNNGQRIRTVTVDQHRVGIRFDSNGNIISRNSQWVSLGRYEFYVGSNNYVRLTDTAQFVCDNSDVQGCTLYFENGKYIVVDAMRFFAN